MMSTSSESSAAPYVWKFDEKTAKKAKDELNEDPKNRQAAINAFRDWIKQQSHMKCPTDDVFLLSFLRTKHFSQLEAREALERFMVLRDKLKFWMKNLDPASDEFSGIFEKGVLKYLPDRDDEGRRVIIYSPGKFDPSDKAQLNGCLRLLTLVFYATSFCDELTQINGIVFIYDGKDNTLANYMKISLATRKEIAMVMSKAFPARLKGVHLCNIGNIFEMLMPFIMKVTPEKLKSRIHAHTHSLETLYDKVPIKILPSDYVPDEHADKCAGSVEEICERMKTLLRDPEVRDRIKHLSGDEFHIKMKDKDMDVVAASYVPLNVD